MVNLSGLAEYVLQADGDSRAEFQNNTCKVPADCLWNIFKQLYPHLFVKLCYSKDMQS